MELAAVIAPRAAESLRLLPPLPPAARTEEARKIVSRILRLILACGFPISAMSLHSAVQQIWHYYQKVCERQGSRNRASHVATSIAIHLFI
jgi:hypothetical protein